MSTKPVRKIGAGSGAKPKSKPKPKPEPAQTSVDLTSAAPSTSPAMPHERDEAAGMTGGVQSKRVQQGHVDVERGVQDTSRALESDTAYRKLKK